MPTNLKDIQEDTVIEIDLSAVTFNERRANELSEALKINKKAKRILLDLCELTDREFAIISQGLLSHPTMDAIDIANNSLSDASLPYIIKIIEAKKAINLNIKGNNFSNNSANKKELHNAILASENKVNVTTDLDINIKKTLSSNSLFTQNEQEKISLSERVANLIQQSDKNTIKEACSRLSPEYLLQLENTFKQLKSEQQASLIKGH